MKNIIIFLFVVLVISCDHSGSKKETIVTNEQDTTPDKTVNKNDSMIIGSTDTVVLMHTSTEILNAIKTRDYKKFIAFIHPQFGIRFSPYAYIDTTTDRKFLGDELLKLATQNKKINWKSGWDEKPELLTVNQYFSKFVYDVDFLSATLKAVNTFHSQGTDLNNIKKVYPGCDVIEFFFPRFEKQYEGMDFRGLRLVFKMQKNVPYLIAIVHDQWTP